MSRKRIAVIGAGPWGRNHIQTLHEIGELGLVIEQSESIHPQVESRAPGVPIRTNATHAELRALGIKGIVVASNAATHAELSLPLLNAGFDILIEKPMTLDPVSATLICEAAEANGRVLMVGHMLLFQPAIAFIKQLVNGGGIGRLRSVQARRRNFGTVRLVENSLWSLGVHDVAVILDIVDSAPTHIVAVGQWLLDTEVADDVTLHMQFQHNVHASLHTSWLWPEKDRGLTVIGSDGILAYDEATQTVVRHKKHVRDGNRLIDEGNDVLFVGESQPLKTELQDFLRAIETRQVLVANGRSGMDVVSVLASAQAQLNAQLKLRT